MNPLLALPAVNFFLADVGGGLGAYLTVWLQEKVGLDAAQIGTVLTISSIVTMLAATPAGSVVDRVGRPRAMLIGACALVVCGVLLLLPARSFWLVIAAQVIVSVGGAMGAPALTALTLSIVGKKGFPRQQGTNEAANHAGNVAASGLIALLALTVGFGPAAAIIVLAIMAAATVAVLVAIPSDAIDEKRMRGREKRPRGAKRGDTRALLRDRSLLALVVAIGCFHLGNAGMLPLLGLRIKDLGGQDPTAWMSACIIVAQLAMVPTAIFAGRYAERLGRRWILIAACAVLPVRALLAIFAGSVYWLIPIEVLDGLAAAAFSVAAPAAVADQTYGSGRTQTSIGAVATVQALAAALSVGLGGWVATYAGWTPTFALLGAFPLLAVLLLWFLRLREDDAAAAAAPSSGGKQEAAAEATA